MRFRLGKRTSSVRQVWLVPFLVYWLTVSRIWKVGGCLLCTLATDAKTDLTIGVGGLAGWRWSVLSLFSRNSS
jgi:hypothetical protein